MKLIRIEPGLHLQLKRAALDAGMGLGELIDHLLRQALKKTKPVKSK